MKYRTEVLHSAAELIPRCWDERLLGASDFYLSTKWLTATELLNDIHPNYIVALDQAGEVIAGLVAFLFDSRTPPWEFYRIDCVLNRLLKKPDHLSRGIANASPNPSPWGTSRRSWPSSPCPRIDGLRKGGCDEFRPRLR
jgi:hypothetical protein